jgi:hypothetical protein
MPSRELHIMCYHLSAQGGFIALNYRMPAAQSMKFVRFAPALGD